MTEKSGTNSTDNYLRVEVDVGPGFEPSPRLTAALDELYAALEEAADPEVAGHILGHEDRGMMQQLRGVKSQPHTDARWNFEFNVARDSGPATAYQALPDLDAG